MVTELPPLKEIPFPLIIISLSFRVLKRGHEFMVNIQTVLSKQCTVNDLKF